MTGEHRMRPKSRQGAMALWLAIALGGALMVMGFMGSMQVSMNRMMLERVMIFRSLDHVSQCAFEEVSGRLEAQMGEVPWPELNKRRDLGTTLQWPPSIDPVLTRAEYQAQKVEVGPVELKVSKPWLMFEGYLQKSGSLIALETGFVEMMVRIKVKAGSSELERLVSCRRILYCEPLEAGKKPRIQVQAANIFRVMEQ